MEFSFELLAAFDFIGDLYMLRALAKSKHMAWTVLTIY